eukprot:gene11788-biopygen18429
MALAWRGHVRFPAFPLGLGAGQILRTSVFGAGARPRPGLPSHRMASAGETGNYGNPREPATQPTGGNGRVP